MNGEKLMGMVPKYRQLIKEGSIQKHSGYPQAKQTYITMNNVPLSNIKIIIMVWPAKLLKQQVSKIKIGHGEEHFPAACNIIIRQK